MKETVSAGGVILQDGKVIVVSQHGTSWSLPKGHVEESEDLMQTAKREIQEETGIVALEYVKKLGTYQRHKLSKDGSIDKSELKSIHMFLFTAPFQDLKPKDQENPEARWVPVDEVAELLSHPKDREFYLSILTQLKKNV